MLHKMKASLGVTVGFVERSYRIYAGAIQIPILFYFIFHENILQAMVGLYWLPNALWVLQLLETEI